jgi:hypothetical protein
MMNFFKFTDKEAFEQTMTNAGFVRTNQETDTEEFVLHSKEYDIDVVGVIMEEHPTQTQDFVMPEGDVKQVPTYVPIDGYHVNAIFRKGIPESFAEYEIERPNSPVRVFA